MLIGTPPPPQQPPPPPAPSAPSLLVHGSPAGSRSPAHTLRPQSSMMETVRHRLETTPQIDVAGIVIPAHRASKNAAAAATAAALLGTKTSSPLAAAAAAASSAAASSPPSAVIMVKHKRQTRVCCGREVRITFLSLLLVSITSVMVLTMIAQLLTQVFTSFSISDNLINICANSTDALLNELEMSLYASLNRYGKMLMRTLTQDLVLDFFGQAQAQVGAFVHFTQSAQIDPMTSAAGLGFLTRQVFASYGDNIDLSGFAGRQQQQQPGSQVYYSAAVCDVVDASRTATCEPTRAVLDEATDELRSCFFDPHVLSPTATCSVTLGFNVSAQVPYAVQRAQPANSGAKLVWSPLYVLDAGFHVTRQQTSTPSSPSLVQNSTGISLSYPIFPPTCNTYSCMQGVVFATITSRALATYCLSLVNVMVLSAANEEAAEGENPFQNNTILYLADTKGNLVAGAWARNQDKDLIIPSRVTLAANVDLAALSPPSSVPPTSNSNSGYSLANALVAKQIADSAGFISTFFEGGFASPLFSGFTVRYYLDGTINACPDLSWDNCSLVIIQRAEPRPSLPAFNTGNESSSPTALVAVITLSVRNLVAYFEDSEKQVANTVEQQQRAQDMVLNSIGIGAAIAVVAVLCGVLVSMIVAVKITEPLGKIEKEMQKLVAFQFDPKQQQQKNDNRYYDDSEDEDDQYYSRVIEVNKAEKVMEKLETSIEVFSKFVPSTVVRGIVQGKPQASQLHVAPCDVTVAFSDIKGFTTISEKLETTDLLFLLTRYLTVMTEVVEIYEGTVTEILGDGLLVIWNAPDRCELHCAKAAACALAMQVAVAALCIEFQPLLQPLGLEDFSVRVGIHSGRVLAGNIGSKTKLKYGCLGDAVNTASRLEGLCKLYQVGIICSQDTFAQFPRNKFQTRKLDLVQVKGKDVALGLYEVQSLNETVGIEYYDGGSDAAAEAQPHHHHHHHAHDQAAAASSASSSAAHKDSTPQLYRPSLSVLRKIPLLSSLPLLHPSSAEAAAAAADSNGRTKRKSESSNLAFGPIASSLTLDVPQTEINTLYEEALEAFQSAEFAHASELLQDIQSYDVPSKYLLSRVEAAQKEVIDPAHWTGANRLTEKF